MSNNNEFEELLNEISKINEEKLYRESLGDLSLIELKPFVLKFKDRLRLIKLYEKEASHTINNSVKANIRQFIELVNRITSLSNQDFVSQRNNNSTNIRTINDELLKVMPIYISLAAEDTYLKKDFDINKTYGVILDKIEERESKSLLNIKAKADEAIEKATLLAKSIEASARETATKVSVQVAQDQFKNAQKSDLLNAQLWGLFGILMLISFFITASCFLNTEPKTIWTWQILYVTAIRISIIGAIGALATFSLKNLRAYMHLRQVNLHRQRISNCMASFVESANYNNQRDIILSRMVDAVCAFGDSGLVQIEDDSISVNKTIIDAVSNNMKKE